MFTRADNDCCRLLVLLLQRDAHRLADGQLGPDSQVHAMFEATLARRDRALLARFDEFAAERSNEILSAAWAYSRDKTTAKAN
jgi:hypothetical protein